MGEDGLNYQRHDDFVNLDGIKRLELGTEYYGMCCTIRPTHCRIEPTGLFHDDDLGTHTFEPLNMGWVGIGIRLGIDTRVVRKAGCH